MNDLGIGSRGTQVELLQLALNRAGFSDLIIDGIFGQLTLRALLDFQAANGLAQSCFTDTDTWTALTPYLIGYKTHTIQSGDTLYHLAQSFGTSVDAIMTANPGIDPEFLAVDSNIIIPLNFDIVPTNINFTSTILDYSIFGLAARYPFIQTGTIGKSVIGKDLHYLSIGTGEHQVFYNASHHANEWITTPILMKFLENYAKSVSLDGEIGGISAEDIYDTTTLYIVPMVNPDGVDLVTGELSSGVFYDYANTLAQNYPEIPFPDGWKANIRGVDLNLQYPAGWDEARDFKYEQGFTLPGPRDFVGSDPLSEPESLAVYQFTVDHDFSLTMAYHTQGQVIFWKYKDYLPPNSYEIALEFSRLSGYAAEETPYGSGNAGYKDWFIQKYNRPGYTIEAGLGVNPLPISQFDEIYSDNEAMLALGAIITAIGV